MRRRFPASFFPCLLLVLSCTTFFSPSANATTVRSFTTEQLTTQADVIIEGHCLAVKSRWVDGTLVTVATVEVDHVLKGNPAGSVEVVIPGGIDMDRPVPVQVVVAGAPSIAPQEEVLLFLVPFTAGSGGLTVLGLSQGKYTLSTQAGGAKLAHRDTKDLVLAPAIDQRSHQSLASLRDEVSSLLSPAVR